MASLLNSWTIVFMILAGISMIDISEAFQVKRLKFHTMPHNLNAIYSNNQFSVKVGTQVEHILPV
jgi:hypothetical protein